MHADRRITVTTELNHHDWCEDPNCGTHAIPERARMLPGIDGMENPEDY